MGSFVAQQVALAAPERVARLVLIGSATTPEFAREFQVGTAYQPLADDFMDRVVAEGLKVPARVWRLGQGCWPPMTRH